MHRALYGPSGVPPPAPPPARVHHEMSIGEVCSAVRAYNAQNGTDLIGRPVSGNHRKPCTDCGASFSYGYGETAYYFTSEDSPWGADKLCIECMCSRMGGGYAGHAHEEEGDY